MGQGMAIYSSDPTRSISPGVHKIKCVRGFDSMSDAHDHALDQREAIAGPITVHIPSIVTLENTDVRWEFSSWTPESWMRTKLSNTYKIREDQIEFSYIIEKKKKKEAQ
jgi:hypothetical protein